MAEGTNTVQDRPPSRGSDLSTLVVAALAAVVAALVTSRLWAGGTLVSTAMTPVIVSLVKEYLQRPVEKIGGAVARAPLVAVRPIAERVPVGVASSAPPEAERRGRVLTPADPDPDDFEALDTLVPPGEESVGEMPYRVYRRRPRRARWWRVGLATGVAAFVVAAAVITVPELLGGGSVASTGRTTLFSHHPAATTSQKTETSGKSSSKNAAKAKHDKSPSTDSSSSSSKGGTSSGSSSRSSSSGDTTQQTEPGSTSPTTTAPDATSGDSTQTTPTTPAPPTTSTPAPPSATQP